VLFFAVERLAVERFAAFLTAFFGALRAVFFAATYLLPYLVESVT
jgi:hypothetical protein